VATHFSDSQRNDEFVRDLRASDLKIEIGSREVSPVSAAIDDGPRRIALVVDDTSQVSQQEWKLQIDLVTSFVEHARRQDQFALFFVGSARDPPMFGDALFLFGHDAESIGDAALQKLREVLLRNRTRFLALSLVNPLENRLPPELT
jgi:hypothetical protein